MYSSDDDDFQSPAIIRRFGARTRGTPGQLPLPRAESAEAPPLKRARTITFNKADKEKGRPTTATTRLTEFNYAPIRDTLILIAKKHNLTPVVMPFSEGAKREAAKADIRIAKGAAIAIASILEMRVRKLLEVAAKLMHGQVVTLNSRIFSQALDILGESQMLKGMMTTDAKIVKAALEAKESAAAVKLGAHERKQMKKEVLADIKQQAASEWEHGMQSDPVLSRAADIFVPRVLSYMFAETGICRSSRTEIRRILTNYAANLLTNLMMRIHPILVGSRRCTITVSDVNLAKDETDRSALLGFTSISHKRLDSKKSDKAVLVAQARKARTGAIGVPAGMPPIPMAPAP